MEDSKKTKKTQAAGVPGKPAKETRAAQRKLHVPMNMGKRPTPKGY